jgi:hypothetical protein
MVIRQVPGWVKYFISCNRKYVTDSVYLVFNSLFNFIRDSPTTEGGDPALCELQVPPERWVAPGKGPFPGLRGG